jgi:hypothetical protein
MIEQITQTENGYQVTIGGQVMSVPNDPANEDYQRVQKAIAGGMKLTVPPGPTAAQSRAAVNRERDRRMTSTFAFAGKDFDCDQDSLARITGAATLAGFAMGAGAPAGFMRWHGGAADFAWIAADYTLFPMDAQTCFAFGQAAANNQSAFIFAAKAIKGMAPIPADFATNADYWP